MNIDYTGYIEWQPAENELAEFYQNQTCPFELLENQYLLIKDRDGDVVDKYCYQKNKFRRVNFKTIHNKFCGEIKPRNPYQELAIDMLQDRSVPVKLFRGTYGSGKDLLMSAEAFSQIEQGNFDKLIYIRPNVSLGGVPEIGYLKGTAEEKLDWTLAPLWDKFGGKDVVEDLKKREIIELVPLSFIRGRSFENSLIYVSESQNITKEVAGVILSRVGENSELWINGDCHQTDKRMYDENNGITAMIKELKGDDLFQMVYSPIIERSAVARLAAKLMGE